MEQKYVYNNLSSDDEIIANAEISSKILVFPIIIASIFFVFMVSKAMEFGDVVGVAAMFILAGLVVSGGFVGYFVLLRNNTELCVTRKKVAGKTGILGNNNMDCPLDKVNTVAVSRGIVGSIFGYGSIIISSSSGSFNFKGVSYPDQIKNTLMYQIEEYKKSQIQEQAKMMAAAMGQVNNTIN